MTRYTEEFKKSIVKKILSNSNTSLRHVARENGVALSTAHGWLHKYGSYTESPKELNRKSPNDWTLEERFNILVETAGLTEETRGIYCRQKGIYQYQLNNGMRHL